MYSNKLDTYKFIAKLLHKNEHVNFSNFTINQLFWDNLVKIGSRHLILPSIFGSIKRKGLEQSFPKDLLSYLEEISKINYERNKLILIQIEYLSSLLKKHKIHHVFLKGAALLISKPYETVKERMIGDIDILVDEKDLRFTQKLLLNHGFQKVSNKYNFTKNLNSAKHLERIINPNYVAAVEIHRNLLDLVLDSPLNSEDFLNNKLKSSKGYFTPSKKHMWEHAILNWQFNDSGSNTLC